MIRKYVLLIFVLLFGIMPFASVSAQMTMEPTIEITDAWARPTVSDMDMDESGDDMMMEMGTTSAVYMTITNNGESNLVLLTVETTITDIIEIHQTTINENNVMQMRPIESAIEIPAGENIELRPGGFHVMLIEPEALAVGDAFALTLVFQQGDDVVEVVVGVSVQDEPPLPSALIITQAWARPTANEPNSATEVPTMGMGGTSAAYMLIENTSDEDVKLISVTTAAAGIVEIHETSMGENDVMQMRPLMDGLTIPAGETLELRPGGFHIMFMDLKEPFLNGDALYLELEFDNGEIRTLGVAIEDRLGMPMSMSE